MSDAEYHGQDEYKEHALAEFSSSAAKSILKSPAHYEWEYLKKHRKKSRALDIGHAVHANVLGTGKHAVPVPDKYITDSGRRSTSKDAVAWESEQEASGLIVVTKDEFTAINAMAENVLAHPDVRPALEQDGQPEVSMFASDPETGLRCRGRFDFMPDSHHVAIDLKTAEDASLRGFTRAIEQWSYEVQHGHYMDVSRWLGLGIEDMVFVVVEKSPPFSVNVIQLDRDWVGMGAARAAEARARYMRCSASGEWPGYPLGVKIASPPPWAVSRFQDEQNEDLEALS